MPDLYAKAGVNIKKGNETVRRIKKSVATTHNKSVLQNIGGFGGLFSLRSILRKYKDPVLVQSIDGVGTKLSIAKMVGQYDSVGEDIVGHSCGDIVAMGARPLTFLDYVANEKLDPRTMEEMLRGMAKACREAGVAIIGGETAEMPGIYTKGEHDIAGAITGIVERSKIITGEKIERGDLLLGLPSSGMHTNGFSLARELLFKKAKYTVGTRLSGLGATIGDALLKVHTNYTNPVFLLIDGKINISGMAHITGGGFIDNIPRILPKNLDARIELGTWPILPIFQLLQKIGKVDQRTMYTTFNMGIGMIIVVPKKEKGRVEKIFKKYKKYWVGEIIKGSGKVILK